LQGGQVDIVEGRKTLQRRGRCNEGQDSVVKGQEDREKDRTDSKGRYDRMVNGQKNVFKWQEDGEKDRKDPKKYRKVFLMGRKIEYRPVRLQGGQVDIVEGRKTLQRRGRCNGGQDSVVKGQENREKDRLDSKPLLFECTHMQVYIVDPYAQKIPVSKSGPLGIQKTTKSMTIIPVLWSSVQHSKYTVK